MTEPDLVHTHIARDDAAGAPEWSWPAYDAGGTVGAKAVDARMAEGMSFTDAAALTPAYGEPASSRG